MKFDTALSFLLPGLIVLSVFIAPYTKVEESFNIQAVHDISRLTPSVKDFDHITFPGSVPRTFVGAAFLSGLSHPIINALGPDWSVRYAQIIVRVILGLFNAGVLRSYNDRLRQAFGDDVARWFLLLLGSQFHVIYYASRTLPNMFAFTITTMALREFIYAPGKAEGHLLVGTTRLVAAAVVFRSEIAILLATNLVYLLFQTLWNGGIPVAVIQAGVSSTFLSLLISVPIDSFFWRRLVWPEFSGFYYNVVEGKAAEWGTSPIHAYFSDFLPRLLLNPLTYVLLIPLSLYLPALRASARLMVFPSLAFVAIYSLQPHKEARFIIYVIPPLTATAALSASYIFTRRSKSLLYGALSLFLVLSVIASFVASTGMLLVSSLNYPGGEALSSLHSHIFRTPPTQPINIHMDVLTCMTGVTRFQQYNGSLLSYDKTEDPESLLEPWFWRQFDYALMEDPGKAIGKWEVLDTVYAYAGIEILRPGEAPAGVETAYQVLNSTIEKEGEEAVIADSDDFYEVLEEGKFVPPPAPAGKEESWTGKWTRYEIVKWTRGVVRKVTGGWWVGPKMEPKIRILRRVE